MPPGAGLGIPRVNHDVGDLYLRRNFPIRFHRTLSEAAQLGRHTPVLGCQARAPREAVAARCARHRARDSCR